MSSEDHIQFACSTIFDCWLGMTFTHGIYIYVCAWISLFSTPYKEKRREEKRRSTRSWTGDRRSGASATNSIRGLNQDEASDYKRWWIEVHTINVPVCDFLRPSQTYVDPPGSRVELGKATHSGSSHLTGNHLIDSNSIITRLLPSTECQLTTCIISYHY